MAVGFYELLQVVPEASADAIRVAYQDQVAQVVRKLRGAESRQQDVSPIEARRSALAEAWAVLSDPARRRRYDRFRELARTGLPADPEALWAEAGPSMVDPAAAAAVEVLRTLSELRVGDALANVATAPEPEVSPVRRKPAAQPVEAASIELPPPSIAPAPTPSVTSSAPSSGVASAVVRPAAVATLRLGNVPSEDLARLLDQYGPTGAYLRAVRELRRIPLDQLSASTRITARFLEALERDSFGDLPGSTFVRGYLKMFVRTLEAIPSGPELDEFVEGYMSRFHRARGGTPLVWTAGPAAPRLDRALAEAFPELSRARIQALIEGGHVTIDGASVKASMRPTYGQVVHVDIPEARASEVAAEDVPLDVRYEDDDVLVLVKPAGMVVHPAPGHSGSTLVNALLGRLGGLSTIGGVERPGIVHRLDAGTSGVMVVAKNDTAHRRLSETFAAHDLDRRYWAVVHRTPLHDGGVIRSELARDPRDRLRIASVQSRAAPVSARPAGPEWIGHAGELDEDEAEETGSRHGRLAVTHWRVRSRADRVALVEVKLETGRTHQVRVHLSEAGHPILGDQTYGRRDRVAPAAIRARVEALDHPLLHALHLAFPHPRDGRVLSFTAPPPADFLEVCALAGLTVPEAPLPEKDWAYSQ